jgi:hypothetical protein
MQPRKCAYCGKLAEKRDKEHVFPKCLYPLSKSKSKVQRLTIPSCNNCNNGWSDDEAHFRNMLLIAGEPNAAVTELWETTANRSFNEVDGYRRVLDLITQMKPIETPTGRRYMVFPGKDQRVVRVLKKIIRGLCYHHQVMLPPISDQQIWVDVLDYVVPQQFLDEMEHHHREADIIKYSFQVMNEPDMDSAWLLTFFERRSFIAIVSPVEITSD